MSTFRGAPEGNDWHNPVCWADKTVPTADTDAVFDGRSPSCRLSAEAECRRLVVDPDFKGMIDTAGWGLNIGELTESNLANNKVAIAASLKDRQLRQEALRG